MSTALTITLWFAAAIWVVNGVLGIYERVLKRKLNRLSRERISRSLENRHSKR